MNNPPTRLFVAVGPDFVENVAFGEVSSGDATHTSFFVAPS